MEEYVPKQLKIIIEGSEHLREFMKGFEIFDQNPEYRQNVLEIFIREHFRHLRKTYVENPIYEINKVLTAEFEKASRVDASLISFFFSEANLFRVFHEQSQYQISQLQKEIDELKKNKN